MNSKMDILVKDLVQKEHCHKIFKFNHNDMVNVWIVLKDETFED